MAILSMDLAYKSYHDIGVVSMREEQGEPLRAAQPFAHRILAAIAIPNLMGARRRANFARVANDTKTAVTQSMACALDNNVYPGAAFVRTLREKGFASVPDNDPWNRAYASAAPLTTGAVPSEGDDVYVFSTGPAGTGAYNPPYTGASLAADAEGGFSSAYGSFSGS